MTRAVEAVPKSLDFNKGNIQARSYDPSIKALAGSYSGAVIGTDHAAKKMSRLFHRPGDGGSRYPLNFLPSQQR